MCLFMSFRWIGNRPPMQGRGFESGLLHNFGRACNFTFDPRKLKDMCLFISFRWLGNRQACHEHGTYVAAALAQPPQTHAHVEENIKKRSRVRIRPPAINVPDPGKLINKHIYIRKRQHTMENEMENENLQIDPGKLINKHIDIRKMETDKYQINIY